MRASRLLLALLLVAGGAQASWMREYDRGLQAVKQEDWAEAERRFAAAIREDPVPQEWRRFQGVVYRSYVPHYYAGLAAWRRGDCQTAMQYWSHAATLTELGKSRLAEERAEHQRGVSACRSRLAQAEPAKPAQPTPAPAATASTQPPASTSATGSRPAATASTPAVAARPDPAPSKAPAQTTAAARPPPAAQPSQPAPAASAPAALRGAVDAWLAGRYSELLRANAAAAGDARSRAQLHLFRAAAAFVLAEQAGQAEGGGLDNARQEVRAARAAQSGLQPDEVLFSPRFRRFWQQTR